MYCDVNGKRQQGTGRNDRRTGREKQRSWPENKYENKKTKITQNRIKKELGNRGGNDERNRRSDVCAQDS